MGFSAVAIEAEEDFLQKGQMQMFASLASTTGVGVIVGVDAEECKREYSSSFDFQLHWLGSETASSSSSLVVVEVEVMVEVVVLWQKGQKHQDASRASSEGMCVVAGDEAILGELVGWSVMGWS